jgi:ABC-type nitrate/sulfonate/bicarbonate transport system substrate-binding protein
MNKREDFMLSIAKYAVALVSAVAAATSVAAQEKVSVGMATGVNQVSSLVAADQGFFEAEGIDVELVPVVRGNLAVEAIVAGSLQFAEVSDVVFFSAIDKGIPLVGLGAGSRGFTGKMVGSPDIGEVDSLADLKGKRIGIQVGTGVHGVFLMLLEKEGMDESDFEISNVRVTDMPTAMASSGTFDAVFGWDPMMQRTVQAGYGKEIISARQFQEMADITYPLLLVADRSFVEANRDTVQSFVNAYHHAHQWIQENPEGALKIYMDTIRAAGSPLDEDIVRNMMFEVDKFTGVHFIESDATELARTRDFLKENGRTSSAPDLEDITDPSFGEAAKAKFN